MNVDGVAVGVDIGGTFTDLVLVDQTGETRVHKVLTTPDNPAEGALAGLAELLRRSSARVDSVNLLVHSTTLVTNCLIERTGTPTALLCTRGFRDVLEMRREQRYDLYDLFLTWPAPLVSLVPGIAIAIVVLAFNQVGDGLRDALDPALSS